MSTSVSEKIARQFYTKNNGNAMITVNVKNATLIKNVSSFGWQDEVLMKAGQRYEVLSIEEQKNGSYIIELKQLD